MHPDELGLGLPAGLGFLPELRYGPELGVWVSGCVVWYWSYQMGTSGRRVPSCKRGTGVVVEKDGTGGVPALELELELELKLGLIDCLQWNLQLDSGMYR